MTKSSDRRVACPAEVSLVIQVLPSSSQEQERFQPKADPPSRLRRDKLAENWPPWKGGILVRVSWVLRHKVTHGGCAPRRRIPPSPLMSHNVLPTKGLPFTLLYACMKAHPDTICLVLKEVLAKLDLRGDVYKLRHTYASRLAMNGVDLLSIKTLLGHTDLKTTQIYAHVSSDHLRDEVRTLEKESKKPSTP